MQTADFTIADVLAFARSKPADEHYNYWCNQCALGQFLVDTRRLARLDDMDWSGATRHVDGRPAGPFATALAGMPYTFGSLAKRLEALLPAEPLSDTWTKADAYAVARESITA